MSGGSSSSSTRSTRGASKQRRDQINVEIQRIRDMLPLPESVKDRLFQLQVMSLACIYIRKHRYFPHVLGEGLPAPCLQLNPQLKPIVDKCKALRGFLLMVTRQGKMLYISENASDYLGHSVEEIMSQGDSIYDLVDPRDHTSVQSELLSGPPSVTMNARFPDERVFICRMNLSRTAKRQLQYHKFVLIEGRYLHPAEYYQALLTLSNPAMFIHPVFAAYCQPLVNPENAETLAAGNTSMFRSLHLMDMKFVHLDDIGVFHLGFNNDDLEGDSWYSLLHPSHVPEVSYKHKLLCQEKEGSVICLIRMKTVGGQWLWLHTVLAIRGNFVQQPTDGRRVRHLIHATYQLLSDVEAATLHANSWIYTMRQNYSDLCSKSNSPTDGDDDDHHSTAPALPVETSACSNPPTLSSLSVLDTNGGCSSPVAFQPSEAKVKLEMNHPVLEQQLSGHQICVEIPVQHHHHNHHHHHQNRHHKQQQHTDFDSVVSSIALNSMLTPDTTSPESSGSQNSAAHSGKSGESLESSLRISELYRPVDKHLPEIEPSALEDYLRQMENGTLFEHSDLGIMSGDCDDKLHGSCIMSTCAHSDNNTLRSSCNTITHTHSYQHLEPGSDPDHSPNMMRLLHHRLSVPNNCHSDFLMGRQHHRQSVDGYSPKMVSNFEHVFRNHTQHLHQQQQHRVPTTINGHGHGHGHGHNPSTTTSLQRHNSVQDMAPLHHQELQPDPFYHHANHPRISKPRGSWAGVL